MTRGNGTVTSYTYDPVSRLASLSENLTGTMHDQLATFGYNPASQIDTVAWNSGDTIPISANS